MSNALISLFVAAGVSALAYSKLGRRAGYGNSGEVWKIVAVSFVISFIVMITLLSFIIKGR
jgi:hypothetical protein